MIIQPPHLAHDRDKLASMIHTLRNCKSLPPVIVHGDQAYSGSHRIEAWALMSMSIDCVEITDDEYELIMLESNLDPKYDTVYDFEVFLENAHHLNIAIKAK